MHNTSPKLLYTPSVQIARYIFFLKSFNLYFLLSKWLLSSSFQQHDHCHVLCKDCWSFRTILVHLRFLIGAYVVHHQYSVFWFSWSLSVYCHMFIFLQLFMMFYLLPHDYLFCPTYSKDSPCSVVSMSCFPFSFISVLNFIYKYMVYLVDLNARCLDEYTLDKTTYNEW